MCGSRSGRSIGKLDVRRLPTRLAEVYRPLLAEGVLAMTVNRAPVVPSDWEVAERHAINVRAGGRVVRGWYGLLPDPPRPPSSPASGSTTSAGSSARPSGSAIPVRRSTRP